MNAGLFDYKVLDGRDGDRVALDGICRLRYQVYVRECGFEAAAAHPDGLERDEYDRHAIHFYACPRNSDEVIGTARIILGGEGFLPVERHFDVRQFPAGVRREQVAEISRLAISKEFRYRVIDRAFNRMTQLSASQLVLFTKPGSDFRRRCEQELIRGLYVSLYKESRRRGVTHWFAVMARGLYVILSRWGIGFEQIGPPRDYHGIRAPYLVSIPSVERSPEANDPDFYAALQDGLVACNA